MGSSTAALNISSTLVGGGCGWGGFALLQRKPLFSPQQTFFKMLRILHLSSGFSSVLPQSCDANESSGASAGVSSLPPFFLSGHFPEVFRSGSSRPLGRPAPVDRFYSVAPLKPPPPLDVFAGLEGALPHGRRACSLIRSRFASRSSFVPVNCHLFPPVASRGFF